MDLDNKKENQIIDPFKYPNGIPEEENKDKEKEGLEDKKDKKEDKKEEEVKGIPSLEDKKEDKVGDVFKEQNTSNLNEEDIAKANYEFLVNQGILEEGKEIKSMQDISKVFEEKVNKEVETYFSGLPEELQLAIVNYSNGKDYKEVFKEKKTKTFASIKEEDVKKDEKLAEHLLRDYLKEQGRSQEYIDKRIALVTDGDFVIDEGLAVLEIRKKQEEERIKKEKERIEAEKERMEKETEKYYEDLNKLVENDKTLWGLNVNKKEKVKLKELMTSPVKVKVGNAEQQMLPLQKALQEDPTIWVQLNYMFMKGMLGEKGDMTFLNNRAQSQATKKLEEIFGGKVVKTTNTLKSTGLLSDVSRGLRGNYN